MVTGCKRLRNHLPSSDPNASKKTINVLKKVKRMAQMKILIQVPHLKTKMSKRIREEERTLKKAKALMISKRSHRKSTEIARITFKSRTCQLFKKRSPSSRLPPPPSLLRLFNQSCLLYRKRTLVPQTLTMKRREESGSLRTTYTSTLAQL